MSTQALLSRLQGVRRGSGAGCWMARCPAHDDRSASLSIRELDDGRTLVHCFADCDSIDVLAAVDLEFGALFPNAPRGHRVQGERRPFAALDVLRAIEYEALLVAIEAGRIANGHELTDEARARLLLAASRIQAAVDAARGAPCKNQRARFGARAFVAAVVILWISSSEVALATLRMSPSCVSSQDAFSVEWFFKGYNLDETKVTVSNDLVDLTYRQTRDGTSNPPTQLFSRYVGPLEAGNYFLRLFAQVRDSASSAYEQPELVGGPLPFQVSEEPVSRLLPSSLTVHPSKPSGADPIDVDIRLIQFLAPSYLESVTHSVQEGRIDIFIDLMQGDFSAQSEICAPIGIGKVAAGHYQMHLWARSRYSETSAYREYAHYAEMPLTVSEVPTLPIIEYHHAGLNHYFLSANAEEIAMLDSNGLLGWTRTGAQFNGYSVRDSPLSALPVCRFYGSTSPGPNSHFYTVFPEECSALQALERSTPSTVPRWNYEGWAFAAVPPDSLSACPAMTPVAVRRFYNGRAALNDSNHRYVSDPAVASMMRDLGWRDEGTSMCAAR